MKTKTIIIFLIFLSPIYLANLIAISYSAASKESIYTSGHLCGECHVQIYNRWKNSLHAFSVQDPIFDSAYTKAYRASGGKAKYLCLRCHAPTTYKTEDYDLNLAISREGVTCDFCHTVKSIDLSSKGFPYKLEVGDIKRGPLHLKKGEPQVHQAEYSKLHLESSFCAGCHEYTNDSGVPILSTYSEWLASPYAAKGIQCQNCHMPVTLEGSSGTKDRPSGKRRINEHNLAGGHSVEQLRKAVKLEIEKIKRDGKLLDVVVKVTNVGSGHMVPTGLPTRKLVLKVEVKTADGKTIAQASKVYQKILTDGNGRVITEDSLIWYSKKVVYDNRLIPLLGGRSEEFSFNLPRKRGSYYITTSISYLYEPSISQKQKMEMVMDSQTVEVK